MLKNYINLIIIFSIFISCAPVPPIQSSRITSHFSITPGTVLNYSEIDIKWGINNPGGHELLFKPYLVPGPRWSIKKRIEISGFYYPPVTAWTFGPAWSLNCKTFLYEVGQPKLFRNFCSSVFVGSNGYHQEWSEGYSIWGGIVLGTYSEMKNGEIEFVLQPSGTYTYSCEWTDGFVISETDTSTEYGSGDMYLNRKSIDIGLGVIYKPGKYRLFEVVSGITFKYYYDKDFYATDPNIRLIKFDESPLFFHLGMSFNFIR